MMYPPTSYEYAFDSLSLFFRLRSKFYCDGLVDFDLKILFIIAAFLVAYKSRDL